MRDDHVDTGLLWLAIAWAYTSSQLMQTCFSSWPVYTEPWGLLCSSHY